jgi:energy-coupling factor transporter ATP-binding protein EcfA2
MKVILENVRTFSGRHSLPLGRLTVLTGENSAGKTTLLGMIAAMSQPDSFPFDPAFDEFPYTLGSYDTIATYKGGRFGRAKSFGVGFEANEEGPLPARSMYASYASDKGRVALRSFRATAASTHLQIEIKSGAARSEEGLLTFSEDGAEEMFDLVLPRSGRNRRSLKLETALLPAMLGKPDFFKKHNIYRLVNEVFPTLRFLVSGPAASVAPIRTRPQRIYSQAKQAFEPAGDHIPFVLDRLLSDESSRSERNQVAAALKRFGKESGLFEGVSIKKLGSQATAPFQLMIELAGRPRNLIDVGYGVSQALPVVVQTVLENPGSMSLLQQPEVHLHPMAQAALGSFFCEMVKTGNRSLVVESHSDFIVDRIRQEVAAGAIPADWVRILFFHRDGYETTVYPLRLDRHGNVLDAPAFYREFFLREELRLLARASD